MTIYVTNLGFHMQSNDLKDLFIPFGEVSSAKIIMDRDTGKSRGFGFVEMPDASAATEAVNKMHGKVVEGKALAVNEARPRETTRKNNFR
jgi:RNA recognition motif-containing protein